MFRCTVSCVNSLSLLTCVLLCVVCFCVLLCCCVLLCASGGKDWRAGRSALNNIIPVSTGAAIVSVCFMHWAPGTVLPRCMFTLCRSSTGCCYGWHAMADILWLAWSVLFSMPFVAFPVSFPVVVFMCDAACFCSFQRCPLFSLALRCCCQLLSIAVRCCPLQAVWACHPGCEL